MIAKKPGSVVVERTSENTTGQVGLYWIYESMRHWGLPKRVGYRFRTKRSNRERRAWDKISAGVLMILSGGSCVEDLEYLRSDTGLLKSLGTKTMVSSDTLLRFLGVKKTGGQLKCCVADAAVMALRKYKGALLSGENKSSEHKDEAKRNGVSVSLEQ